MAHAKSDFDVVTKGFIQYLEKTGQLSKLPHLAKEQVQASRSLFDPNLAIVQTVVKLESAELKALQVKLETKFNRPIKIVNRINRNILGGILIRIGDEIIDLSLKNRIKKVKDKLTS